ncbi:hypothetical protein BMD20_27375 [Burkholderia multivorans]|nr:hypothetical protein BMD20_27375 [Burkholderia multivorans]
MRNSASPNIWKRRARPATLERRVDLRTPRASSRRRRARTSRGVRSTRIAMTMPRAAGRRATKPTIARGPAARDKEDATR